MEITALMSSEIKRRSNEPFFKPKREFPQRGPGGFPIGAGTKKRAEGNRALNKMNIPKHCEGPIEGICVKTIMLTWSHALKTRFQLTLEDRKRAIRQCLPCHQYCEEKMTHKERAAFIDAAIARRKPQSHDDL